MENLIAKMSCFARAFHRRANTPPIFNETTAEALLGSDYAEIARDLCAGATHESAGGRAVYPRAAHTGTNAETGQEMN